MEAGNLVSISVHISTEYMGKKREREKKKEWQVQIPEINSNK
jgi:hypothetical protein